MHFFVFESSFCHSFLATWAYATHPNVRKWSTFDFLPNHGSNGVISLTVFVGFWFRKYTAVDNASAQNLCGSFASANIDCTDSTSVRFILLATPFCTGVFGTVSSCLIPSVFCNFWTQQVCIHHHCPHEGLSYWFFHQKFHSRNCLKTMFFCLST